MSWLLDEETAREYQRIRGSGISLTAEQEQRAAEAAVVARDGELPRIATRAGNTVEIRVQGVLTKNFDLWAYFFLGGNTTYRDIQTALRMAKADAEVTRAVLFVDSPGGNVDGLFDTLAAIEDFRAAKELTVRAENALSAAYTIAAAAGAIQAQSAGSTFGSVGVAISLFKNEDVVDLTNSESPDKRPDVSTKKGKAVVVRHLDAIFDLMVEGIAAGRGTTEDNVRENFGRGASLLAREALERGMIDSVAQPQPALRAVGARVSAQKGGAPQARKENRMDMDLKTFRAEHRDLYDEVFGLGREDGVKGEQDRVNAHLNLGEQVGDMKLACEGVRSGEDLTQSWQSKYIAAGLNKRDQKISQQETDTAGAAADGAADLSKEEAFASSVIDIMEARRGKKQAG